MRNFSTNVVYDLVKKNKNVMALTADNRNDIYDKIRIEYPNQYIDYGIAESNMIASAAGLASCGKIPFLYTITNFMSMRAFEFIRNDVCVANQNVKFLGRSSGIVSSSMGATHQGTEEIALMRCLENMLVITPATPIEARQATYAAYKYNGPVYIRLEGFNEPELYDESYKFEIGKGTVIREGMDITIISTGSIINEAIKVAENLKEKVSVRIINLSTVKPIDTELILQAASETGNIITLEEHTIYGGLGSAVSEVLSENGCGIKFKRMGLRGFSKGCGNRDEMREINGIDCESITQMVKALLK
jgi:transketolase